MSTSMDLWKEYLTSDYLGKPEVEVNTILFNVGVTLGNQPEIFKEAYLSLMSNKAMFKYKPKIGAEIEFLFDYESKEVLLRRMKEEAKLSFNQFQRYMGLIDTIFSEVYPLGSVIELNEERLPEEIRNNLHAQKSRLLLSILGRRQVLEDQEGYIDYIAAIWPNGLTEKDGPFFINNMLIKRVISVGLTNEVEKEYVEDKLRRQLIDNESLPLLYTKDLTEEVAVNES